MEGNDDEFPARREDALCREQRRGKLKQFVVYIDTQRLKGARRGIDLAWLAAHDSAHDLGETRRCRNRRLLARLVNRARDLAREFFLPEHGDDAEELALVVRVHDVGGARPARFHAHVERPLAAEGEAAFELVELHRRHTDIEHDTVGLRVAEIARSFIKIGKTILYERQPSGKFLDERGARRDRALVAIDPDHTTVRRFENRARIAARAEGAVDVESAVLR